MNGKKWRKLITQKTFFGLLRGNNLGALTQVLKIKEKRKYAEMKLCH
jgi:hypothetical protein